MKTSDTSYLYLWVHSALAATSITFFLALLSADPSTQNATEILLTSFFFTISLILNSLISIYFVWLRDAGGALNSIFKQKKAFWVIKIGVIRFNIIPFILLILVCSSCNNFCFYWSLCIR